MIFHALSRSIEWSKMYVTYRLTDRHFWNHLQDIKKLQEHQNTGIENICTEYFHLIYIKKVKKKNLILNAETNKWNAENRGQIIINIRLFLREYSFLIYAIYLFIFILRLTLFGFLFEILFKSNFLFKFEFQSHEINKCLGKAIFRSK